MPCIYGKKSKVLGTFGWTYDTVCTNRDILRKMPPGREDRCMYHLDQTGCPKYAPSQQPAAPAPNPPVTPTPTDPVKKEPVNYPPGWDKRYEYCYPYPYYCCDKWELEFPEREWELQFPEKEWELQFPEQKPWSLNIERNWEFNYCAISSCNDCYYKPQ